MANKFVNLKKEYRDFVLNLAQEIQQLNINDSITNKKCIDVFKLFQKTSNSINNDQLGINANDINHIIENYNKENKDVDLIKRFIKIKNLYIIQQIVDSLQWKPFIYKLIDLPEFTILKSKKKELKHLVEKGVYKLLISTVNQFNGCWEIAEFKDNKLKKIEIIEPEHIKFIIDYVHNKFNHLHDQKLEQVNNNKKEILEDTKLEESKDK